MVESGVKIVPISSGLILMLKMFNIINKYSIFNTVLF